MMQPTIPSLVPYGRSVWYDAELGHLFASQLAGLSDEQLVERCRRNDSLAFDSLMKRYERPIISTAYRLAGNYDDAHEVAAEARFRIYKNVDRFNEPAKLGSWINRIVVNAFLNALREKRNHHAISLDELILSNSDMPFAVESNPALSPHLQAEANERQTILNEAIKALPNYQRQIVSLFHSQGRSYSEIADILQVPLGTVKSRLKRARLALRELLAPHFSALN